MGPTQCNANATAPRSKRLLPFDEKQPRLQGPGLWANAKVEKSSLTEFQRLDDDLLLVMKACRHADGCGDNHCCSKQYTHVQTPNTLGFVNVDHVTKFDVDTCVPKVTVSGFLPLQQGGQRSNIHRNAPCLIKGEPCPGPHAPTSSQTDRNWLGGYLDDGSKRVCKRTSRANQTIHRWGCDPQEVADELAREANYVFGHYNLEIYLEKMSKD